MLKMMPSYCEQHPGKEIELYCYDCDKIFCVVCGFTNKHNTHKCSDVKKSAEEFRAELDGNITKLGSMKCQEEMKQLDEERSKFISKMEVTGREIEERYNKLRAMLDKHQNELMEELKSYEVKHLKEIEMRKDEVERMFVTMESFKRYCTEVKDKGTPCEISRSAKDLRARTEELLKTEEELMGNKLPFAEIMLTPSTMSMENAKNWIGELSYKTAMVKQNQVLLIEPPSELTFVGPFTSVVPADLKLSNPSPRQGLLKVKTTAPNRYCMRPNGGVTEPQLSTTGLSTTKAMVKQNQALLIEPPSELTFVGPFTSVVSADLKLSNPSPRQVLFKVKATAPKHYSVRPNGGVIEPGSHVIVNVMLQPFVFDAAEKNTDKFMVQSMLAPDIIPSDSSASAILKQYWKSGNDTQLMESKLRCVLF